MKGKSILLLIFGLLLVLGLGGGALSLWAQEPPRTGEVTSQAALTTAFTYQGQLKQSGNPVNGTCDFNFSLYDAASGGMQVGSTQTKTNISVSDGLFTVQLDFGGLAFQGDARWLKIEVRCPAGSGSYTALSPRQALTATPYALYAKAAPWSGLTGVPGGFADGVDNDTTYTAGTGLSVVGTTFSVNFAGTGSATTAARSDHDHVGEEWYANIAWSNGAFKVYNYGNGPSIWGWNGGNGNGLRGYATGTGLGVYGESVDSSGVGGRSTNGRGVAGNSINGDGVFAHSDNGSSLYIDGAGKNGVQVDSAGESAIYVGSAGNDGVRVMSAAWSGVYVYGAGGDAIRVQGATGAGLRIYDGVGINGYIRTGSDADLKHVLTKGGDIYIDGSFYDTGADFAEMMATSEGVTYEPGDLLVIGPDGKPVLSFVPDATNLLGVYSTDPGYVGSVGDNFDTTGKIPVAITGIVPVKACTENGAILPGDLLTSSSIPGHAMKTSPVDIEGITFYLPGTILGKALESLEEGTGVILVLVTLQ